MQKYRIYSLLILFPSIVFGEWTPIVWNMTNTWNNIITTNLYAIYVVDTITESAYSNVSTKNIWLVDTNEEFSACGYWLFGPQETNEIVFTNSYFSSIGTSSNVLSIYDHTTTTCEYVEYYFADTNKIVVTVDRVRTGGLFQFQLDVQDRRYYELWKAMIERVCVLESINYSYIKNLNFYHESRPNDIALKQFAEYLIPNFGYFSNSQFVAFDKTSLLTNSLLPTNYFEYTSYKKYQSPNMSFGRVVTSCANIIIYPDVTNYSAGMILTNYLVMNTGETNIITGTNGQYVCSVVTNSSIMDGFTTWHYQAERLTNILANLTMVLVNSPTIETIQERGYYLYFDTSSQASDYYTYFPYLWECCSSSVETNYLSLTNFTTNIISGILPLYRSSGGRQASYAGSGAMSFNYGAGCVADNIFNCSGTNVGTNLDVQISRSTDYFLTTHSYTQTISATSQFLIGTAYGYDNDIQYITNVLLYSGYAFSTNDYSSTTTNEIYVSTASLFPSLGDGMNVNSCGNLNEEDDIPNYDTGTTSSSRYDKVFYNNYGAQIVITNVLYFNTNGVIRTVAVTNTGIYGLTSIPLIFSSDYVKTASSSFASWYNQQVVGLNSGCYDYSGMSVDLEQYYQDNIFNIQPTNFGIVVNFGVEGGFEYY